MQTMWMLSIEYFVMMNETMFPPVYRPVPEIAGDPTFRVSDE